MSNEGNGKPAQKLIENKNPPFQMVGFFSTEKSRQIRNPKRPRPAPALIYKNSGSGLGVSKNEVDKAFDILFEETAKKISTEIN